MLHVLHNHFRGVPDVASGHRWRVAGQLRVEGRYTVAFLNIQPLESIILWGKYLNIAERS
jgi:hypothetical protein